MKKNGFTLMELMGVIVILSLLIVLCLPSIVNFIKSSNDETDKITLDLIYNATENYIKEYKNDYPKIKENVYCIPLIDLVDDGKLKSPIKFSDSEEDITNKKIVEVTYDGKFKYELKSECIEKKVTE